MTPTPPAVSAADLLDAIRRLRLVEDPAALALASCRALLDGTPADAATPASVAAGPGAVAAALVRQGVITEFQAGRLLRGRGAELVIRQYVLLDLLGEGGMGRVYRARHRVLGRIDAVKLLRSGSFAGTDAIRRFRQEARLAARCSHPNLVAVYDADDIEGVPFLAMEFVPGTDLHKLVRTRGPLPVGVACDYTRQAALGLHHAHEQGLIHRDVKPANLLLSGGRVRVTDLGLARTSDLAAGDSVKTATGAVLGTPDFISPEQCVSGQGVDRRADVYALGCTLYFLLTGRPPFPGGTPTEKLLRHLSERPTPIRAVRPEVPEELAALLDRTITRDPANRPPTAAAVADALAPFCEGELPPPPSPPRPQPAADVGPTPATQGPDTDTGWVPSLAPPTRRTTPVPVLAPPKETAPPAAEPVTRPHRRWRWALALGVAVAAVGVGIVAIPDREKRVADGDDLRKSGGSGQDEVRTDGDRNPIPKAAASFPTGWRRAAQKWEDERAGYALVFSPAGDRLLEVCGDSNDPLRPGAVRLWDATGGRFEADEPLWSATVSFNARSAAFATDGSLCAVGCGDLEVDGGGTITLFDPASGKPVGTTKHQGGVLALAFARSGRTLLSGGRDGMIRVWDVSDLAAPRQVAARAAHKGSVQALAFSPDGTTLASGGADGVVKLWSGRSWENAATLPAPAGSGVRGLAFLNKAKTLVAGLESRAEDGRGILRLWDLTSGKHTEDYPLRSEKGCPVFAVTVAPDDRTVLAAELNHDKKGILRIVAGRPAALVGYFWDGSKYANSSYTAMYAVAISPDGTRVVTSGSDSFLSWWVPDPKFTPSQPPW